MEKTEQKKSWLSSVFEPLVNLLDDAKDSIDRALQINGYGDNSYWIDYTLRNAIHYYPEMDVRQAVKTYMEEEGEIDVTLTEVMDYAETKDVTWFENHAPKEDSPEMKEFNIRHAANVKSHNADMKRWDDLSHAVGGDMFDNPDKLAIMRKVDSENEGIEWDDFAAKVLAEINAMPKNEFNPS